MTIDSVTGAITNSPATGTKASTEAGVPEAKDQFGKDTFLQLMVAQLRYQDPTNPTDSSQFLSQTAQFTTLEKLIDMAKATADLLSAQKLQSASAMIGKQVSWQDGKGVDHTGVVTSTKITADGPQLRIDNGNDYLALDQVREIAPAPTKPAA